MIRYSVNEVHVTKFPASILQKHKRVSTTIYTRLKIEN